MILISSIINYNYYFILFQYNIPSILEQDLAHSKSDLKRQARKHQTEIDDLTESLKSAAKKLTKASNLASKYKSARDEAELQIMKLETELKATKTLLTERNRECKEVSAANETLESKNARLRKEIITAVKERNDADTLARDKKFSSNIKAQKIKVLKKQIRKKKRNKLVASQAKLDKDTDYLDKEYALSGMNNDLQSNMGLSNVKSHRVLPQGLSKLSAYKGEESDSGVSDINEDDYYDSQFERDNKDVHLPKILGRTPNMPTSPSLAGSRRSSAKGKGNVYKSWMPEDDELKMIE